jgi:fatty-acyl-CoA synthase
MKLAFSTLACPGWSMQQVADAAVDLGYNGVELRLIDGEVIDPVADRDKVEQAVRLLRGRDLEVCAFDTSCTLNHRNPRTRDRLFETMSGWIDLAKEMEVPILRVFGGETDDPTDSYVEQNGWVAGALNEIVPEAEHAGVTIALETHDQFSSARRIADVLAGVHSPAIGVLWDSHHPYEKGETAEEVVTLLGKRIVLVHVKDARWTGREGDEWELVPLGEGQVPVGEMLEALHRFGYGGYISVEWEKKWHPELAEPKEALPQHIAWLQRTLQEIGAR